MYNNRDVYLSMSANPRSWWWSVTGLNTVTGTCCHDKKCGRYIKKRTRYLSYSSNRKWSVKQGNQQVQTKPIVVNVTIWANAGTVSFTIFSLSLQLTLVVLNLELYLDRDQGCYYGRAFEMLTQWLLQCVIHLIDGIYLKTFTDIDQSTTIRS